MSGVGVGTQLVAPEGYRALEKGKIFYFLRNSPTLERVLLLEFVVRPVNKRTYPTSKRRERKVTPIPFPKLIYFSRTEFEQGMLDKSIVSCEKQFRMPPWLSPFEGMELSAFDDLRPNAKRAHSDRIDEKLNVIQPLVKDFESVLDANDPDRHINSYARSLTKKQNETRVRLWFYTYIAFGRNRFALMYPIHQIGHWNRMGSTSTNKRGRPSSKGRKHGYNTTADMRERIIAGYRRECGIGVYMDDIYVNAMRKDFGCKARDVKEGKRKFTEIFHPDGAPFPTPKVFEYFVVKEFGRENVARTLFGKVRARSKTQPPMGAFTEKTWNLMQKSEQDAYAVKELPRGLVEGSSLPPLYVVCKRDTASGMKTGIGFSLGGERAAAYRMATFCEAIGKVKFCSLFGIEITEARWASIGVSPYDVQDRGAGATPAAASLKEEFQPVISNMAPSYSGQSKAVVESSHPKDVHDEDAPTYIKSEFRTFELVRREIFELLRFNEACYIGDRVPPDLLEHLTQLSPNGLWELLDSLGRNDAVQMGFAEAVRAYLDQQPACLESRGVRLNGQIFKSPALAASGALNAVLGRSDLPIKVYVLDACTRHIWMDWEGRLIELDLTHPVPVGNEVLYMSLAELRELEILHKHRKADHQEHAKAVNLKVKDEFRENVGKEWNAGHRVPGRPKRGTRTAKQEASESKAAMSGGIKWSPSSRQESV